MTNLGQNGIQHPRRPAQNKFTKNNQLCASNRSLKQIFRSFETKLKCSLSQVLLYHNNHVWLMLSASILSHWTSNALIFLCCFDCMLLFVSSPEHSSQPRFPHRLMESLELMVLKSKGNCTSADDETEFQCGFWKICKTWVSISKDKRFGSEWRNGQ